MTLNACPAPCSYSGNTFPSPEIRRVIACFATLVLATVLCASGSDPLAAVRSRAAAGDVRAEFDLGTAYALGNGVPRNQVEAAKWYRLAAEGGLPDAQFNLGVMYAGGIGVPQDSSRAACWYLRAAEQGVPEAQFNIGTMYAEGDSIPRDIREAAKWYRKAAEQGYAEAQCNLGVMYSSGDGVPQDLVEAHAWFNAAGANGDRLARANRDRLEAEMTAAQKAAALRLAEKRVQDPKKRELLATNTRQEAESWAAQ